MAVVDYISGMTDIYALETYQLFKGIKVPSL
jgi:dGTP triphosphohydrolase